MRSSQVISFLLFSLTFLFSSSSPLSVHLHSDDGLSIATGRNVSLMSPFSAALETLQKQIGYQFQKVDLLRRAMTHASYSKENNRALAILGIDVIDAAVAMRTLKLDNDASAKDLNDRILAVSKVDNCAADGFRLGLQNVLRVSLKTNSSMPAVICGAFRAIFGAVAVDVGKVDDAGDVLWKFLGLDGVNSLVSAL